MNAVVLLSSGLDSTVNLYAAIESGLNVKLALTFDYGQRAAQREIEHAAQIAGQVRVPHEVVNLPWLKNITHSSLVNRSEVVPTGSQVSIDSFEQSTVTAKAVWVPNRNGIFLNVGAAYAETLNAEYLIPGFNIEEAQTFPDNSADFLAAATHAFSFSTANKVKTKCLTTAMNKTEIVRFGKKLGVPFELVWPCYFGDAETCGQCESCLRFQRAMGQGEQ